MEVYNRIGSALHDLHMKESRLTHSAKAQISMDLRFLKMFFWCYAKWECTFFDQWLKYGHLECFVSDMEIAGETLEWYTFFEQWLEKADLLKLEMKEVSLDFVHSWSIQYKTSTSEEIHEFLDCILENLEDLFSSKARMFVPVKEQFEVLQQKLKFLRDLVKFTAERCNSHEKELNDFRVQVQAWANRVACVLFLYWVDQNDEETVPKLKAILLRALEIKPCTPVVKRMLLGALKSSKFLRSETFLMGHLVANSVDLLLEDLTASMEDSIKTNLRDGLIILMTFLMDPPMECGQDWNEILSNAEAVADEAASLLPFLRVPKEKEGIPNERYILDLLEKVNILKAEIREHYVQIQDLSLLGFPKTNVLDFIDFLSGNLKERACSITFGKFLIQALEEKLQSVRAYLKDLVKQQNEIEELKHLWTRIINGAYAVEHVVDSCFFEDDQIWHKMICLSSFKDEIEFIMTQVKKIRDEFMNNIRVRSVAISSSCTISKHAKTSRVGESMVGFKNEATKIIDQLTRGPRQLKVVSIVGMAGQGKTTLADKIYTDPSVNYHFNKRAWCFVSQVYQRKELMLEILSGVIEKDDILPTEKKEKDDIHNMSEEDLEEKLYRSLKGQRYLIVMDDIWDIKAFDELKQSFPDDTNGSRILFTSRIQTVASQSQAKLDSSTYRLCPLSIEESWELLQKKLFHDDCCPPYLSEVGMKIVNLCEGLPLSIVVTAGVLARRVTDLDWWKEIEGDLSSKILSEGCKNILELSYKHLPDVLKPCLLYFAAFQQGQPVNVRRLTQLWVAERFIPKMGERRPEAVALEFLMDLIDRSLVIVAKRSSSMGIKECRVHDLLFDLCLAKVKQDNFLRPLTDSGYSPEKEYWDYRLSIHTKWVPFDESDPTSLHARTLLIQRNLGNIPDYFFMKFKFARVLDLRYSFFNGGFPKGILSLFLLRYLDLRIVIYLPSSIENLKNLEVFRVDTRLETRVPDTIWNMKSLRHVHVRNTAVFVLGNHLRACFKLRNVDTLSRPILCGNESGVELLRRFPNVRILKIRMCSHKKSCCQLPEELCFLRRLESLNVKGRMYLLPKKKKNGRMKLDCDLKFPSTLKKLTLEGSGLPWSKISVIGKLPNLEVLKLLRCSFEGERWDMEDEEFSNLKFLKLYDLDIREWNTCTDPFPCLQRLVLEYCVLLEEIPSNFGEITTLNVIEVHRCNSEAESSALKILSEQQDYGNDGLDVLITKYA